MKKFALLFSVICLFSIQSNLWAQGTFSIGPRAGVNLANVSENEDGSSVIGLVAGLTSTYSFNESSGITVDVLYSAEGFEAADETEVDLNYLQVPIYYNLFFGNLGDAFRPKIFAGVAPGLSLGGETGDIEIDDQLNSFSFSVTGGVGFNYQIADRLWLNTDLRAFLGLTDIYEDVPDDQDAAKARNLQLSVGLAYGLSEIQNTME